MRIMTRLQAAVIVAAVMAGGEAFAQGGGSRGGADLPFSQTYRRPNVSPYMQLQQQGLNPLQNQKFLSKFGRIRGEMKAPNFFSPIGCFPPILPFPRLNIPFTAFVSKNP